MKARTHVRIGAKHTGCAAGGLPSFRHRYCTSHIVHLFSTTLLRPPSRTARHTHAQTTPRPPRDTTTRVRICAGHLPSSAQLISLSLSVPHFRRSASLRCFGLCVMSSSSSPQRFMPFSFPTFEHPDFRASLPSLNAVTDEHAAEYEDLFIAAVRHAVEVLRGFSAAHRAFILVFCFEAQQSWPTWSLLPDVLRPVEQSLVACINAGFAWRQSSERLHSAPQSSTVLVSRDAWTAAGGVRGRHNPYAGQLLDALHRSRRRTPMPPLNRTPSQQWLMHCAYQAGELRTVIPRDVFGAFQADCSGFLLASPSTGQPLPKEVTRMTVSVSVALLRKMVVMAFPRAFSRFVGTEDTGAWCAYLEHRVGLHLLPDAIGGSEETAEMSEGSRAGTRVCLGPWKPSDNNTADDYFLGLLFRAALRTREPHATPLSGYTFLAQAKTLSSAAVAVDEKEAVVVNDRMLSCVLNHYYLRSGTLVMHANEMMACVLERAACDLEPAAWLVGPHIIALISALTDTCDSWSLPSRILLGSTALCAEVCGELVALFINRHDLYRHVGADALEKRLFESIHEAVTKEVEKPLEQRFCSPWCASFRDFALSHQHTHRGLASFLQSGVT